MSERGLRIAKTCTLYLSSTAAGMCTAITGPTLLELQKLVKTDTRHIALIYTARSSGYLFGSLIGGVLFDMTPRKQFLMTIFCFLIAVSMFALPWSKNIETLTGWMVLNGFSLGALDTGLSVWCFNLWGKESGPFYQALHFTYGFGSLIAPLVAAPFLGNYTSEMNSTNYFINQTTPSNFEHTFQNKIFSTIQTIPSVFYGYAVIGSLTFLATVFFLVLCIIAPLDNNEEQYQNGPIQKRSFAFLIAVVLLTFLLLFMVTGNEIGFAQMVTTYAVKGPSKLSPTIGSYITSSFWAALTMSRFSSIFLAIKFSNLAIIVFSVTVTGAGAGVLSLLEATEEWTLWLASVLLGIGIAPLYPAVISWIEKYITITNKIVAVFAVGAAFGEMVIPYTISHFIEEAPEVLSYVVTASCVFSTVFAFILYLVLRNMQDKYISQEDTSSVASNSTVIN